jgi:probable HAF family extracellular repeat protein
LYRSGSGAIQDLSAAIGKEFSTATDINDSGIVTGYGGADGIGKFAFRFDVNSGVTTDLGVLSTGDNQSLAMAVNKAGVITGVSGNQASGEFHAFLYDGKMLDIGPAFSSADINDAGVVVGSQIPAGQSQEFRRAFRYDSNSAAPQFLDLGVLAGCDGSEALGVNQSNDIVGYSFNVQGDPLGPPDDSDPTRWKAFLVYHNDLSQTARDLNDLIPKDSGWILRQAFAINDVGQIVGLGHFQGIMEVFLLTPIVPATQRIPPFYAAIDPLALLLPGWVYVDIHAPDPAPERLPADIQRFIASMSSSAKTEALNKVRSFSKSLRTLRDVSGLMKDALGGDDDD